MTREEWLGAATHALRPYFAECGYILPGNIRASCGFPSRSGLSLRRRTLGQCWAEDISAGRVFEIFVSPTLHLRADVLSVLAHELVHATVGIAAAHRAPFVRCGRAIGLEGRPTQMGGGVEFYRRIEPYVNSLGPYPHDEFTPLVTVQPQSTRMIKCECGTCGYVVRTTRRWIEDVGPPHCPDHGEMEVAS